MGGRVMIVEQDEVARGGCSAEMRRVRFQSIDGLERADIPLACEVWVDDVFRSRWADPNAMKLAMHLARYICEPNPQLLQLTEIEACCQLLREDISRALMAMKAFGAVVNYSVARAETRATLNLSLLQRVRVLELKGRLGALAAISGAPAHGLASPP